MAHEEYPKMIYLSGQKGIIVNNKEEETKLVNPAKVEKKEDKKPATWGN